MAFISKNISNTLSSPSTPNPTDRLIAVQLSVLQDLGPRDSFVYYYFYHRSSLVHGVRVSKNMTTTCMLDELQMNVSKRTLLRALARLKKSGALKFFPKTKTVIVKEFV